MICCSTRLLAAFALLFNASVAAAAPPTQRAPREKYRAFAMVHQGDAEPGKALLFEPQKIACSNCHTTDGKGGKAGPDLFAIGDKYGRDDLIQQVLEPSATIAVGYSATIIRTKAGDVFQGIVKESNEQAIGLMGTDGQLLEESKGPNVTFHKHSQITRMLRGERRTSLTNPKLSDEERCSL